MEKCRYCDKEFSENVLPLHEDHCKSVKEEKERKEAEKKALAEAEALKAKALEEENAKNKK
jgi:hypothetical protein